jgi:hypothetical protein
MTPPLKQHAVEAEPPRDAELEQAWRNGWGSALNFLRACNNMAGSINGLEHPEAQRIISRLIVEWVDHIEGLTEEVVISAREIGLASPSDAARPQRRRRERP